MGVRAHFPHYSGFDLGILLMSEFFGFDFGNSRNLTLALGISWKDKLFKAILLYIYIMLMSADMKNIIYSNNIMSNRNELVRRLLSGFTMSELQNLVNIREEANRPISPPRRRGRQQEPRRNVRQLIQCFEDNPIPPYRSIPAPRIKKQQPVPVPRTPINEKRRALNGYTKSFEISLKSDRDALVQLQNTRLAISRLFETILNNTKGFKFVETLKVTFTKRKDDANIYKPAYFNGRAQIVSKPNNFIPSF